MVIIITFIIIENTHLIYTIIFSNSPCMVIFTTAEKNSPMPHTQAHVHTHTQTHTSTSHSEGIYFIFQNCL